MQTGPEFECGNGLAVAFRAAPNRRLGNFEIALAPTGNMYL